METKNKIESFAGYRIFTRRQIIITWSEQSPEELDSYCCPNCRDILYKDENGKYYCDNDLCKLSRRNFG